MGWMTWNLYSGKAGDFSFLQNVQIGSGAHSAANSMATGGCFLGVNPPGRKVDHSPPSSAEVKNKWNSVTTHPIHL